MSESRNRTPLIYGILSVACPFVIVIGTTSYQWLVRHNKTESLGPTDTLSATLMDFGEGMQLMMFVLIGCIIGLILAVLCLAIAPRRRAASIAAYLGMAVNGLPLLYFLFVSIKERFS